MAGRLPALLVGLLAATGFASPARATPIPQNPTDQAAVPAFSGAPATAHPVSAPKPPRHPFMAANGRSNIHDDAYQTDTYRQAGPLGVGITSTSTFLVRECGSLTFDRQNRIVAVCVGLDRPILMLFDPTTLETLASMDLPPRMPGGTGNPFTDFSGGGYFFLNHRDRAVVPTTTRHVFVIGETAAPGFRLLRDYDLSSVVPSDDAIISALPDWTGRIWFATKHGIVGTVNRKTRKVRVKNLGEPIGNSFAVDETGGVYIVSDAAMYRFDARHGAPTISWRRVYPNIGIAKPGQTEKGSGTTPTLMGKRFVAITDNGDPMHVVVYKRRRHVNHRRYCRRAVFSKGAGSTDNSLIGTGHSLVVENNYGYTGPSSTENGATTTAGLARVDLRPGRCRLVWTSPEQAPSVVAKLSLANGLVYTYTKPTSDHDPWYLTTLDFRNGNTVWSALSGTGLGYNNNYAPVTIGPDGAAYVGVLGGLVRFADS